MVEQPGEPRPCARHGRNPLGCKAPLHWTRLHLCVWSGPIEKRVSGRLRRELGNRRLLKQRGVQRHVPRHARVKVLLGLTLLVAKALHKLLRAAGRIFRVVWDAVAARGLQAREKALPKHRAPLAHMQHEARQRVRHPRLLVYHRRAGGIDHLGDGGTHGTLALGASLRCTGQFAKHQFGALPNGEMHAHDLPHKHLGL